MQPVTNSGAPGNLDKYATSNADEDNALQASATLAAVDAARKSSKKDPPKPLACTQCRARKRKCNKVIPCNECRKRDVAHLCTADVRKEPPSYGKLTSELSQLQSRLTYLETFLLQKHADFHPSADPTQTDDVETSLLFDFQEPDCERMQFGRSFSQTELIAPDLHSAALPALASSSDANPADQLLSDHSMAFAETLATFRDFDIFPAGSESLALPNALKNPVDMAQSLYPTVAQTSRSLHHIPWAQNLVAHLISVLPPLNMCKSLAELYFDYASRMIYSVNRKQFLHEFQEFEIFAQNGSATCVDPAWLALLFIMLSFGLISEYEAKGAVFGAGEATEIFNLADKLGQCSQGALAAADWCNTPNLRVVQTLIVTAWWAQHLDPAASTFEPESDWVTARVHTALAHCKTFGLDKLGVNPDNMPKSDSALGFSKSGFHRQMGLRVWSDYKYLENLTGCYLIDRNACSSARPTFCSVDDLGWSLNVNERSNDEYPPAIFMRLNFDVGDSLYETFKMRQHSVWTFQQAYNVAAALESGSLQRIAEMRASSTIQPPVVLGNIDTFIDFVRMNVYGGRLRLYRAAMYRCRANVVDAKRCEEEAKRAACEVISCLTTVNGLTICSNMPLAVSFMLNACVLLLSALRRESATHVIHTWLELITAAARTFSQTTTRSRCRPIITKAQKAMAVVANFAKRLRTLQAAGAITLTGHTSALMSLSGEKLRESPGGTVAQIDANMANDPTILSTFASPLLPDDLLEQLLSHPTALQPGRAALPEEFGLAFDLAVDTYGYLQWDTLPRDTTG